MPLIRTVLARFLFASATYVDLVAALDHEQGITTVNQFEHLVDRFFSYLGWAALGTALAVGFGIVLGLLIELTSWLLRGASGALPINVAIGGALFGLVGGPLFGIAFGLLHSVAREHSRGRSWRVRTFAAAGAIILMAVPWLIGLLRNGETLPEKDEILEVVGAMTFLGVSGAIFGSLVGLVFPNSASKPSLKVGESLDEFP